MLQICIFSRIFGFQLKLGMSKAGRFKDQGAAPSSATCPAVATLFASSALRGEPDYQYVVSQLEANACQGATFTNANHKAEVQEHKLIRGEEPHIREHTHTHIHESNYGSHSFMINLHV